MTNGYISPLNLKQGTKKLKDEAFLILSTYDVVEVRSPGINCKIPLPAL